MAKPQSRSAYASNKPADFNDDEGPEGGAEASTMGDINEEWGDAPEGWEEESTGFPPYWHPGEGKVFRARILLIDARDPDFIRYVCTNTSPHPLMCARGPAEDAEPVEVPTGGQFTVSEYKGLPLAFLLGQDVMFMAKEKVKTKTVGQQVWVWKMKMSSAVKALLNERKNSAAVRMAELMAKAEAGDVNKLPVTPATNKPVEAPAS